MKALVSLKDVAFQYPGSPKRAVEGISFTVPKGRWTALVGHNGSGKSTIARLIDGLLAPLAGSITVDGLALNNENLATIRRKIGFVFQNPDNQFVGTTVGEDVAFGLENRNVCRAAMQEKVARSLQTVGMADFIDEQPANLSGGQKQRVALAGVLALEPQLVILDEATSMLDPEGRQQIDDLLLRLQRERQLTILAITHDTSEASLADHVVVINDGHLVEQGPAATILSQSARLQQLHLKPPFVFQLKQLLIARGIQIPEDVNNEQRMVDWLCRQYNSQI